VLYNPLQDLLSSVYTGDSDIDVKWNADQTFDQRRHMRDLFDSPGWKERVLSDKEFCKEPRHVVIRFSADGFPLFKDMSKRTAWAGASDVITMKAACRDKPHKMLLHFMTTTGREPKSLQGLLLVLVDDLLTGQRTRFRVFDSEAKEYFVCKVKLLYVCAD
jgi:hypothetical protein